MLKPKTYKEMKERFLENTRNMQSDDCPSEEYNMMEGENETISWIAQAEGKKRDFEKWCERCYIQIQAEEDGID